MIFWQTVCLDWISLLSQSLSQCHHNVLKFTSNMISVQTQGPHWRSQWGWWTQESQAGGRQPSLQACCGCTSTQRCQTPSQAPTASSWSALWVQLQFTLPSGWHFILTISLFMGCYKFHLQFIIHTTLAPIWRTGYFEHQAASCFIAVCQFSSRNNKSLDAVPTMSPPFF